MKAAVFDLDGTLIDTLGDIRDAINYALRAFDCSPVSDDETRRFVGNGLRKALTMACAAKKADIRDDDELDLMFQLLMQYYRNHPYVHSRPYDGIAGMLGELSERGVKLAILSNKEDGIVQMIVSRAFPGIPFASVHGHRPGYPLKPDPRALEEELAAMGVGKEDAVYIGDSEVDWKTGANSGVRTLIVSYGFRKESELLAAGCTSDACDVPSLHSILLNG